MCLCLGKHNMQDEEVVVKIEVAREVAGVPVDTGASAIWVDREWFLSHGGSIIKDKSSAVAANAHAIVVCGKGKLEFQMWGVSLSEAVIVAYK